MEDSQTPQDLEPNINQPVAPEQPAPVAPSDVASGTEPQATPVRPKPNNKLRKIAVALLVLILLGAAAYGATKLTKSSPATSAATKRDVALLRVGMVEPNPFTYFPNIDDETGLNEINSQVFESLTAFQDKTKVVPQLAVSWTNPDSSTWVFKLRSGVKFHDGNSLTAKQVKASLDQLKGTDYGDTFDTTIKDVTAVDPLTVKITTTQPDPLLSKELAQLFIWDTDSATKNSPANGTGPYTVKPGAKQTDTFADLVAWDNYWGGRPSVRELQYTSYASNDAILKDIQAKKLDMGVVPPDTQASAYSADGYAQYQAVAPTVYFMGINTKLAGSPLANPTVRQAMFTAIDPAALMKANGAVGQPANQLVTADVPGYDPTVKAPTHSAAAAKALLAKAGYPNGFTISFTHFSSREPLAQELVKEFAAAGITLTDDNQTDGKVISQKVGSGAVQTYYFTDSSDIFDSSDVLSFIAIDTPEYTNASVDQLFNKASVTFNDASRLKLLQQVNHIVATDLPALPLYQVDGVTLAARNDLRFSQDTTATFTGLNFWKVYQD